MHLLVDIGHTRLKWAWAAGAGVRRAGAQAWQGASPADLVAALAAAAPGAPQRIGIAAVARTAPVAQLVEALRERFGVAPQQLAPSCSCAGVRCGYADPAALGVDRWAGLIGAWRRAPGRAAVVADAGSALTIDVLAADGRHLGGSIAPGLALAGQAFYARTGHTPASGTPHPRGLGANTADAVASGALLAAVGAVEAVWRRHAASGPAPLLWLTGGDCATMAPLLEVPHEVVPDLVFEGMDVMLGALG